MNLRAYLPPGFPKIITLCGSTKFKDEFIRANFRETMAGNIVLSVGFFSHSDSYSPTKEEEKALDVLHFRKVEMSDGILVIDVVCRQCPKCKTVWRHDHIRVEKCSCAWDISDVPPVPYIGYSTKREIEHAQSLGKEIRYLSQEQNK